MSEKTFAIHTLGCKVNTYESDAVSQLLRNAGFEEKAFSESADIYIINTCTVTNIADRKSRQMLHRARKQNPNALVLAMGCYVNAAVRTDTAMGLIEDGTVDLLLPNKDKGRVLEEIEAWYDRKANGLVEEDPAARASSWQEENKDVIAELKSVQKQEDAHYETLRMTELDGHTRAFVKIQDGCNQFCSYCIIPYVRGRVSFRDMDDAMEEIQMLADQGVAEIVLTGIQLGALGDQLIEYVRRISEIDGIKRIRMGSMWPQTATPEFIEKLSKFEKFCPQFHLSMQSGSDSVLKSMNRTYTSADYERCSDVIKAAWEHPSVTTDIIVGFPGETEENFVETMEFVRKIGLFEATVFKYSRRKGTVADRMPDQIPETVKTERSARLIGLTDELSHEFRAWYIGKEVGFLSEDLITIDGETYETGYTKEFVRCIRKSQTLHRNEIITGIAREIRKEKSIDECLVLE